MAKSQLSEPFNTLESEIIETLLAGHKQWRPDLSYPESHSDMQGAVRGLLRMFEVKRRPLPMRLTYPCRSCEGLGHLRSSEIDQTICPACKGKRVVEEI